MRADEAAGIAGDDGVAEEDGLAALHGAGHRAAAGVSNIGRHGVALPQIYGGERDSAPEVDKCEVGVEAHGDFALMGDAETAGGGFCGHASDGG